MQVEKSQIWETWVFACAGAQTNPIYLGEWAYI